MPGPQTSSPSSVECCFCRWTNSNPFCVVEKWLYRSSYILTTTLSQILSDVESWAQSPLKLHILWLENNPLSKLRAVWVYINTGMIVLVKIIRGVKIASLGWNANQLKLHLFLMFQEAFGWLFFFFFFSPCCRARCVFLLSEDIKADYSFQGVAWALGTCGCHESIFYNEKRSHTEEQRNAGGKETTSQGWEEGVLPFLVDQRGAEVRWQMTWENLSRNLFCFFSQRSPT